MAKQRLERRLTAVLAADVAGYSRLMSADEEGTLARIKEHRRVLVDPKIEDRFDEIAASHCPPRGSGVSNNS